MDSALLIAAVETLSKIGAKGGDDKLAATLRTKTVPALTRLLGDSDEAVQLSAVNALGAIGVEGRAGVARLIDMLKESDAQLRLASIEALVRIAAAEKEAKVPVRAKCAFTALAFLWRVDNNPQVSRAANLAMIKIGQPVAADVPDLLEVAGDKDKPLAFRAAAAQVLNLLQTEAKGHVEPIAKLLKADEAAVRVLIAEALGGLGPEGKAAIAPLLEALKDDDLFVRVAVVQALGDIGQFFPQPIEPTLRALFLNMQEPAEIHDAAAEALKKVSAARK